MSNVSNLEQQLIAAQEVLMHLQHEFEQLHQVVLAQQNEIDDLKREVRKLNDAFEAAGQSDQFPTPEEDRPPHY